MATITIKGPDDERTLTDPDEIEAFLSQYGIWYRRFEGGDSLGEEPTNEEILAAYQEPIDQLMAEGGFVTADVINIHPGVPNVDTLCAKFSKEHYHTENEVRFIVGGSGLFHVNPENGPVFSIEVVDGDMINVPAGTHHWFDLCQEKAIRAIRLFEDMSGWTPHYTDSGKDAEHVPMCFGPAFIRPALS